MKNLFHIASDKISRLFNKSKPTPFTGSGFDQLFDFLIKEISVPKQAERLIAVGRKVKGKPVDELIRNYISFEHHLITLDPEQKYDQEKLRAIVKQRFPDLLQNEHFALLFEPEELQKLRLAVIFSSICMQEASGIFGNAGNGLFEQVQKELEAIQYSDYSEAVMQQMQLLIGRMYAYINTNFGTVLAEKVFDNAYRKTSGYYKEAGIIHFLAAVLPQSIVLSSLLSDLTQAQAQKMIKDKMEETQRLNMVLEHQLKQLQQARDDIKRQETLVSGIVYSSLDAMITIDEEGKIINWNRAAEEIFGYTYTEASGQLMADLIIPDEFKHHHKDGFSKFLTSRQSSIMGKRLRLPARRKNNSLFPAELTIAVIEHNGVCHFNGFLRDISEQTARENELKKTQEEAEQAARIKTDFLNTISHEINTPLNSILGSTYLSGKAKTEKDRELHNTQLRFSTFNLQHLINDILDFNKLETGSHRLNEEVFKPADLLVNVRSRFDALIEQKGLQFYISIDKQLPETIITDLVRLQAVLSNLVNNAIKFTKEGFVKLEARLAEAGTNFLNIDFLVEDSGIGIEDNKKEEIFHFFTQAESTNTRRFGGAGLGLSIVHKTVQLMKGSIILTSEPGKGSIFCVRIPVKPTHQQQADNLFDSAPDYSDIFAGRKILLAEDNDLNIMVARQMIEDWSGTIEVAYNGHEAIKMCMEQDFDLVLMDLQMPDMDGITSCTEIRKFDSQLPVIALTASPLHEITDQLNACKMNGYLRKPINPAELYFMLCKHLLQDISQP